MAEKIVLIITSSIDGTVDYIIQKYNSPEVCFKRVNVDLFNLYCFDFSSKDGWTIKFRENNEIIELNDVYSIYYRKPRLPDLSLYEKKYHPMISKDIVSVINGIVDGFDRAVLSKPCLLKKTENKIFQIQYALANGFFVPDTYIGNTSDETIPFIHKKSIIKPISMGKINSENSVDIFQTCIFNKSVEDIALTPVYLQSYIEKKYEVRITIIDGNIFPVKIESSDQVDWRKKGARNIYAITEIPTEIEMSCLKMLRDFDLTFGAFDFIVNTSNEWFFLEINPNGQWLWLEQELHLDISKEIVQYLLK